MAAASTTLTQGSLVLEEEPFVFIVKNVYKNIYCNCCLKRCDLAKCKNCNKAFYCSRACQRNHWQEIHKYECKLLKFYEGALTNIAQLDARLFIKLGICNDAQKQQYEALPCFENLVRRDKEKVRIVHCMKLRLTKLFMGTTPTLGEIYKAYSKTDGKSFEILNNALHPIGIGFYFKTMTFRHSCKPNLQQSFKGPKLVLRAVENIPDYDATKGCINFIDRIVLPDMRQEFLTKHFYMQCNCNFCLHPSKVIGSAACQNIKCKGFIDIANNVRQCNKCGLACTEEYVKEFFRVTYITKRMVMSQTEDFDIEIVKALFEDQIKVLHRLNVLRLRMSRALIDHNVQFGNENEIKLHGPALVEGLRLHFGNISPELSKYELMLGTIIHHDNRQRDYHINKALKQAEIIYGADGQFTKFIRDIKTANEFCEVMSLLRPFPR